MIFEVGVGAAPIDRFFPEEHPPLGRKPFHQMLRPLRNKIPAQVRKADQGRQV
jgi:hypothetical protein